MEISKKHLILGLAALAGVAWAGWRGSEKLDGSFEAAITPRTRTATSKRDGTAKDSTAPLPEWSAALRSGDAADRDRLLKTKLPELLHADPHAAAQLAESLEKWAWREDILHFVAREWAVEAPEEAAKWAVSLRNPAERLTALHDVCVQAATGNPAEAVALAERFGVGDEADSVTRDLLQAWADYDFGAAVDWAAARPPGEARDQAYLRLALSRAAADPVAAAGLALECIPAGPVQDEAVIAVLHQWLRQDPEAAAEWVLTFPDSPLQRRAAGELAGAGAVR